VVSFIFKNEQLEPTNFKHKVSWNQLQPYFFYFGWLVPTPAASQQRKKIFFLATSTLLQVPVPAPVLKIQVPVQVPVLCMQVQVPVLVPKNVLKYNLQHPSQPS